MSEWTWQNGELRLRVSAYVGLVGPPEELVTSVRCLVRVGDRIVVCTNADEVHPWPGGRRDPGETFEQTAAREVTEETGWMLEAGTFQTLGWLHLEHRKAPPPEYPWPHPDFCQIVGTAVARERAATTWTDTEGYETSSELLGLAQAATFFQANPLASTFLALIPRA